MIKVMKKIDKLEFVCPICKSPIHRIIKEDNRLPINSEGEITEMDNIYEDYIECTRCHTDLTDITEYDPHRGYYFCTHGTKFMIKEKMNKLLSENPFGKED